MRLEAPIRFQHAVGAAPNLGAAEDQLRAAVEGFPGRVAVLSSFGADSAVLLHMVAGIDRDVPVLMLDTLMLFEETLAYQTALAARLGLTDVRRIRPDAARLAAEDRFRALHQTDPDRCCALRKVAPLEAALAPFRAVVTGRKRHQAGTRAAMPAVERDGAGRLRINPLAAWGAGDLRAYALFHDLPPHPLVEKGFGSIGCAPCTTPVGAGEDPRAGRWRGQGKTECGIHLSNPAGGAA